MNHQGQSAVQTILLAQLARFGDFLQTTPLLAALKIRYPGARLTVLVDRGQAGLAGANPDIDQVWSLDLAKLRTIARSRLPLSSIFNQFRDELSFLSDRPFDLAINLNTSRVAALLGQLIPAKSRIGPDLAPDRFSIRTAAWADFIMNLMKVRPLVRFNLVDLLTCYAGLETRAASALTYPIGPEARIRARELLGAPGKGPLIGFQLGSRHLSRQWPPENFAALARSLIRNLSARIALLGTEAERPLGLALGRELTGIDPRAAGQVIDLMGKTSIEDLGGVLAGLDLLVTTDTGTMHLAAAVKTPILALFMGPALCHETGPYGPGHLVFQVATECSPCSEGRSPCRDFWCRRLIEPDMVARAAEFILKPETAIWPGAMKTGPRVRLLASALDDFGVVYRPLVPWPADRTDLLALACREAGRAYLRPGYRFDRAALGSELAGYLPPEDDGPEHLAASLLALENKLKNNRINPWPRDPDLAFLPGVLAEMARREHPETAHKFLGNLVRAVNYSVKIITGGPDRDYPAGPDDLVHCAG